MIKSRELKIITKLHTSTKRDYVERMINDKIYCMKIAKKYGKITGMETENLDMEGTDILKIDGNL